MRRSRLLLLSATLALTLPLAQASTVYLYVGNDFQNVDNTAGAWASASDYISGWFTLAAPLPANSLLNLTPLDWSLSDGVHTLDQSTPNLDTFVLSIETGANANFLSWSFLASAPIAGPDGSIRTTLDTTNGLDLSSGYFSSGGVSTSMNMGNPGVWSSSTTIPEPGSIALTAVGGLVLIGGLWRRRRRHCA